MKRLILIVVFCVFATSASADLEMQIKLEKNGEWGPVDPAALTYEEVDGVKVIYETTPDPDSASTKDVQEWFVPTEDGNGWNLVSFSARDAGIMKRQYWFRVGDGARWSPAADKIILALPAPVPK